MQPVVKRCSQNSLEMDMQSSFSVSNAKFSVSWWTSKDRSRFGGGGCSISKAIRVTNLHADRKSTRVILWLRDRGSSSTFILLGGFDAWQHEGGIADGRPIGGYRR